MTRGGRKRERDGPERRCIATGESAPARGLIRFVLGPDGDVVPDIAGRLPGRGVWLTADRALAERAAAKRLFARAFRGEVVVPADLPALLERLLAGRLVEIVSLARKAGQAVTGFEKVRERLGGRGGARARGRRAMVLVEASDGAPDGRAKLAALAPDLPVIGVLGASELGLAFGRDFAIHAALDAGGLADRALTEAARLAGFRIGGAPEMDNLTDDRNNTGRTIMERGARGHRETHKETGPETRPGQDD